MDKMDMLESITGNRQDFNNLSENAPYLGGIGFRKNNLLGSEGLLKTQNAPKV